MNFWKQVNHVLKYWRAEEDPKAKLPTNFMSGFLEVRKHYTLTYGWLLTSTGAQLDLRAFGNLFCTYD